MPASSASSRVSQAVKLLDIYNKMVEKDDGDIDVGTEAEYEELLKSVGSLDVLRRRREKKLLVEATLARAVAETALKESEAARKKEAAAAAALKKNQDDELKELRLRYQEFKRKARDEVDERIKQDEEHRRNLDSSETGEER